MIRHTLTAVAIVSLAVFASGAEPTVKVAEKEPPKELSKAMRDLLDSSKAINVIGADGKPLCTIWPRKELAAKANADIKSGAKYSNLEETTVLGAVQFVADWSDYRKQKIKPGVYTLRLGLQPMDGDHMGTSPYNEFALLIPADADTRPDLLDLESLYELSKKSNTRKHPGIMLLFPNRKPTDTPAVESKPKEHWVVSYAVPVKSGGEKGMLGFSIVIVGETVAE